MLPMPADKNRPPGAGVLSTRETLIGPAGNGSAGARRQPPQLTDLWGPLQRRKYLVALMCLFGAGLGYLHFSKGPKSFLSVTRLLITTKAPPSGKVNW